MRAGPIGIALVTAAVCRISLVARIEQAAQTAKKGTPQPIFSTGLLWCVTVALIAAAGLLVAAAFRAPGAGIRVGLAAAVPAVLAMLVARIILTRRATNLTDPSAGCDTMAGVRWPWQPTDPAERVAKLTAQREQLAAELAVVEEDAAWAQSSDSVVEQADGASLARQAAALRAELNLVDARLLRAQLDAFG